MPSLMRVLVESLNRTGPRMQRDRKESGQMRPIKD